MSTSTAQPAIAPAEVSMGETLEMFERLELRAYAADKLRAERFRRCFDVLYIIQRETDIPLDTVQPGELTVDHLWNASHGKLVSALVHIEQHTARARDEVADSMQLLQDQIARQDEFIMRLEETLNWRKEIYDHNNVLKSKLRDSKLRDKQRQFASERQKRERRLTNRDVSSSSSGHQVDNPSGVEHQADSSDQQGIFEYSSNKVAQQGASSEAERTDEGIAGEKADRAPSSAPAQLQAGPGAVKGERRRRRTRADFRLRPDSTSSGEGEQDNEAAAEAGRASS